MSLSLLNIYNKVTSQSWSIYESDLTEADEIEKSVILSIQKALRVLWNAHNYCFRLKNKKFTTSANVAFYARPDGNIVKRGVRLVGENLYLKPVSYEKVSDVAVGTPQYFYIKYNKLCLSPVPDKEYEISVDYNTFKLGRKLNGEGVYNLEELSDVLDVPPMFEDLFLHALMNKAMLNALASGKSELYQPYMQQFMETYRNLVLNTLGVELEKEIKW